MEIAPLGTLRAPGEPVAAETLLAGHFLDEDAPAVAEFVREVGGEVVANVDETWTRPRVKASRNPWGSPFRRGSVHAGP